MIGHRGAAGCAPENTLAGLRKAKELDCRWVEFDVRLTADSQLILLHDERLERTTDGRGKAALMPLDRVRGYDAGYRFGDDYRGERVPTLAEAIGVLERAGHRRKYRAESRSWPGNRNRCGNCRTAFTNVAARSPCAAGFELSRRSSLSIAGVRPLYRHRSIVRVLCRAIGVFAPKSSAARRSMPIIAACTRPLWPRSAKPDMPCSPIPLMMPRGHGLYLVGGSLPCSRMFPILFAPGRRPDGNPRRHSWVQPGELRQGAVR